MASSHRITEEEREEKRRRQQRQQAERAANQDAVQARDAIYSNNSRANQRDAYRRQNERASRQDNAQYEQPYYDSNQRAQQRRIQDQKEANRLSAKATRDEAGFNRTNQSSQKLDNKRRNSAYAREEAAFNKGRDSNADRLNAARLKNQRDFQQATSKAQRQATHLVGNSSVPSTNPTAAGGNGRTWKNHKYKAKVIGKNGKVRYIYDVTTASGRKNSSTKGITGDDLKRAGEELRKAKTALNRPTTKATLDISAQKASSRNTGGGNKVHNPIDDLRRSAAVTGAKVKQTAGGIAKAASDGADYVKKTVSGAIANTPLKDLF